MVANVTVTTDVVVTDFVTYCPEPTHLTVNNKTITVVEPTTITILGPCTIPTTVVKPEEEKPTSVEAESKTASKTAAPEVSSIENGANKAIAGAFAGVAAVAAALL